MSKVSDQEFFSAYADVVDEYNDGTFLINVKRTKQFNEVFELLKSCLVGKIRLSSWNDDMIVGCGVIEAEAESITAFDTQKFAKALSLADNYEVYPKTTGTIVFAMSFYGLKTKISR